MASGPRIDQSTHAHFVADVIDPTTNRPINPGGGSQTLDETLALSTGEDIADALTGSNNPSAGNAVATMADIPAPGAPAPPVLVRANGLIKDWSPAGFDPDTTTILLVDPTAQDWQAGTEYSNAGTGVGQSFVGATVHRVGDDSVRFIAFENGAFITGLVEPTWSVDGATTVIETNGNREMTWTPSTLWAGPWQATTALTGTGIYNGNAWQSDGAGNSGGSEPIWPALPNFGDTVTDGAITWTFQGPAAVWTPGTRFAFRTDTPTPTVSYTQPFVLGTAAVLGVDYVFVGQPTSFWGTTGDTEPDWGAAVSGDGSVWIDGDIMWQEDTANPTDQKCVITGIVAPSALHGLTVVNAVADVTLDILVVQLEDAVEVVSDWGSAAQSLTANEFNAGDTTILLSPANSCLVVYTTTWQPSPSVS